jgi:hypothetical protein
MKKVYICIDKARLFLVKLEINFVVRAEKYFFHGTNYMYFYLDRTRWAAPSFLLGLYGLAHLLLSAEVANRHRSHHFPFTSPSVRSHHLLFTFPPVCLLSLSRSFFPPATAGRAAASRSLRRRRASTWYALSSPFLFLCSFPAVRHPAPQTLTICIRI